MTINEIIVSKRIPREAILKGDVNHIIRIANKNKWSKNSVFELKESRLDKKPIKVIILDSSEQVAKRIPEEILTKCYYRNQDDFKNKWVEKWHQKWDGEAWVVKFGLLT